MKRRVIGIVDYGAGNHNSVFSTLSSLDYRCHISHDVSALEKVDCLVLPGVGAFPRAMAGLKTFKLVDFLSDWALQGQPMLGICLGMQLLAERSHEDGLTPGLKIIPGEVLPLKDPRWHIGWNSLLRMHRDPLLEIDELSHFYFNHAYAFSEEKDFQVYQADCGKRFPAIIRRGSVVGLQFHPEKSQTAGRKLLKQIIDGLCHA